MTRTATPPSEKRQRGRPRNDTPYAYFVRSACPQCGSFKLVTKKTYPDENDGTRLTDERCVDCGYEMHAVWEGADLFCGLEEINSEEGTTSIMLTIDASLRLISLGKMSLSLSASPERIAEVAAALGIAPSLQVNGIYYFSQAHLQAIRERLSRPRGDE
jgi:hypothetical protein